MHTRKQHYNKMARWGTRKLGGAKKEKQKVEYQTLSLLLTGAREGDIIEGFQKDTMGTVLRIVKGDIPVEMEAVEQLKKEDFIKLLAKQFNESPPMAEQRYKDLPGLNDPEKRKKHDHLGGCTFEILQPGVWSTFAEDAGKADEFNDIIVNNTPITYKDILPLVGVKTLIMRHSLFKLAGGPTVINEVPAGEFVTDTQVFGQLPATMIYYIENHYIAVPPSAPEMLEKKQVKAIVAEALQIEMDDADLKASYDHLVKFSQGGLKSALQKVIRFGAKSVQLSYPIAREVKSSIYSAMAMALLIVDPGMFNPDIQTFVFGRTSAFKRLAIILLEDAWMPTKITELNALMSLSLVTSQVREWYPPKEMIVAVVQLASQAPVTPSIVNWRKIAKREIPGNLISTSEPLTPRNIQEIQNAAKVLEIVRSFKGDIEMYATFAKIATEKKELPLLSVAPPDQPDVMPDCHIWDQHNKHGIGHVLPVSYGKTFAERFQKLFTQVTGMNPRWTDVTNFEERDEVQQARYAQHIIMKFALNVPQTQLQYSETYKVNISVPLQAGVLSSATGHIKVKNNYVLLGIAVPTDEIVMKIPKREKKEELYTSLSNEERQTAILECRKHQYKVKSPLLGAGVVDYSEEKTSWCFNGRPWEEVRAEGITIKSEIHSLPPEWPEQWDLNSIDGYIRTALQEYGSGIIMQVKTQVSKLVRVFGNNVTRRVRAMLRQQYYIIAMPTPSKDGKQATDKAVANEGDWLAYRFLVLLSRIVPGALRIQEPPNFKVQNAGLLRWVEQFIRTEEQPDVENNKDIWHTLFPEPVETALTKRVEARPAQHSALNKLIQRDTENVSGHILVMPMGTGKTTVTMRYIMQRVLHTDLGNSVKRIIWLAPEIALQSLQTDMETNMGLKVYMVDKVHEGKKASDKITLKNGYINIIEHDNLRKAMKQTDLDEYCPTSIVVIDEFDKMFGESQRTSAGRSVVRSSPLFIAQTGTVMSKKTSQLSEWLADTETYPVNDENYLVAASNMVQIQLKLDIVRHENIQIIPMVPEVRESFKKYRKDKDWLAMAKTTQTFTDDALCKVAQDYIIKDVSENGPTGGVLLVADSNPHAVILKEKMKNIGVECTIYVPGSETEHDPKYQCVIVTKNQDRGYNFAIRFGAMVKGVYAGNPSSRQQMSGRICRIGQKRKEVFYVTVFMESSMMELLHQRQETMDGWNLSLEQIAQQFQAKEE